MLKFSKILTTTKTAGREQTTQKSCGQGRPNGFYGIKYQKQLIHSVFA
jgi:hypothetical protein